MKILIELPTWLGDSIMTTPAIENIIDFENNPQITIIGSKVSIEALKNHPSVIQTIVIKKQYFDLYKSINNLGNFDKFFSFRSSIRSKFIKFFISAHSKHQFKKNKFKDGHQVEKYNNFVTDSLGINNNPGNLKLYNLNQTLKKNTKLLGINPGASYGSSKRWRPKEFANIAIELSNKFDILIFGSATEKDIADEIENLLIENGISNYTNLVAKTSISQLISNISNLDLFITGDSGPMHIAASFEIPTVSIFGPTNLQETSQWMNTRSAVVKKNLDCQPCMKRDCPLKHHNCMKFLNASEVLSAAKNLN